MSHLLWSELRFCICKWIMLWTVYRLSLSVENKMQTEPLFVTADIQKCSGSVNWDGMARCTDHRWSTQIFSARSCELVISSIEALFTKKKGEVTSWISKYFFAIILWKSNRAYFSLERLKFVFNRLITSNLIISFAFPNGPGLYLISRNELSGNVLLSWWPFCPSVSWEIV